MTNREQWFADFLEKNQINPNTKGKVFTIAQLKQAFDAAVDIYIQAGADAAAAAIRNHGGSKIVIARVRNHMESLPDETRPQTIG